MDFKNTQVFNFEGALRGMRNPLNSWDKSDSFQCNGKECYFEQCLEYDRVVEGCNKIGEYIIGKNDLTLAQKLIKSGPEHAKFLRQIFTSVDVTAPLYWWKEADTYKVGTTANSTSTMHKLTSKPFERTDFEFENGSNLIISESKMPHGDYFGLVFDDCVDDILYMCNLLRDKYLITKDKHYWRALVQILPNAYLQTRTWTANYAVLRNIYFQRKNHKLSEWHQFCDWIKSLPYSKELIILGDENES